MNIQPESASPQPETRGTHARKTTFKVSLAASPSEVLEAQRLRYKVFAEELGARLSSRVADHDVDYFDRFCDHLIVRDCTTEKVVGAYRMLSPDAARRAGGYYTETEFNLGNLKHIRHQLVEVGRSCIHQDYRTGGVIALLWLGLADYVTGLGADYIVGCASVGMADGGRNAANLYQQLAEKHQAPGEYRVFPNHPLPHHRLASGQAATVPPLVKGYLRVGAWICGEPAWDHDFNCADLPVLLPMGRLNDRYKRHFVGN
jgi:putative hemolysin